MNKKAWYSIPEKLYVIERCTQVRNSLDGVPVLSISSYFTLSSLSILPVSFSVLLRSFPLMRSLVFFPFYQTFFFLPQSYILFPLILFFSLLLCRSFPFLPSFLLIFLSSCFPSFLSSRFFLSFFSLSSPCSPFFVLRPSVLWSGWVVLKERKESKNARKM